MKSMRKVFAGILMAGGAVVATSTLSAPAAADDATAAVPPPGAPAAGPHGWGHGSAGGGPGHLYSKLGLSAEQQASIKAIMTAAKPTMKSMHDQMRANHLKLMQIKPDDP